MTIGTLLLAGCSSSPQGAPAAPNSATPSAVTPSPSVDCETASQADWQEYCASEAPEPDGEPEPEILPFNEYFDFANVYQDEVGTDWKVRLSKVECGLTSIGKADSNPDWDGSDDIPEYVTAKPEPGNTFCILTWDWKNVGKVSDTTVSAGDLVLASGEAFSPSSEDQDRSWTVLDTRLGVEYAASVNPRGKTRSLDIYQIPEGEKPTSVKFPFANMVSDSYLEIATQ